MSAFRTMWTTVGTPYHTGTLYDIPVASTIFTMPKAEMEKPVYLRQEAVANCCGANWLAGFPHPVPNRPGNRNQGMWDYTPEHNAHLVQDVANDIDKLKPKFNSVQLIVINHLQKRVFHETILSKGFQMISDNMYHAGHGHTLTMYQLLKYPEIKAPTNEN